MRQLMKTTKLSSFSLVEVREAVTLGAKCFKEKEMNSTVTREENKYMELVPQQADVGLHNKGLVGDHHPVPLTTKRTHQEPFSNSGDAKKAQEKPSPFITCQSDGAATQRFCRIIVAVLTVSFLTAAATLALALIMMMSRNSQTASINCTADQEFPHASTLASSNEDKIIQLSKNVTKMKYRLEDLTNRLESTQRELDQFKTYFTAIDVNRESRNLWIAINRTAEKTIDLAHQINNMSKMAGSIGPPGFNGSQGPVGPAGFNGSQGPARPSGFNGSQGPVGLSGFNGSQGPVRPPGFNGSQGPVGPPGFNGSQGPAGPPGFNGSQGPAGPPGPKGAGDFSTCQYKVKIGTTGGGDSDAYVDEPSGYIILAVTCSTNYARYHNLMSINFNQKRRYICSCTVDRNNGQNPKNCKLHYWICSKT